MVDWTGHVLNKKDGPHEGAIYIGRGSPFGNPFIIHDGITREDVIRNYERYLLQQEPELIQKIIDELVDKDLECFCFPRACHGDVIAGIAELSKRSHLKLALCQNCFRMVYNTDKLEDWYHLVSSDRRCDYSPHAAPSKTLHWG